MAQWWPKLRLYLTNARGYLITLKINFTISIYSVFSPLHTVVKNRVASDDLPDLSPPEFSKSIRIRNSHANQKPTNAKEKSKTKIKRTVNTKLLLDNSTNSSRSSSGSGGKFFDRDLSMSILLA